MSFMPMSKALETATCAKKAPTGGREEHVDTSESRTDANDSKWKLAQHLVGLCGSERLPVHLRRGLFLASRRLL